jgi:hypothetical protein
MYCQILSIVGEGKLRNIDLWNLPISVAVPTYLHETTRDLFLFPSPHISSAEAIFAVLSMLGTFARLAEN